MMNNTHRPAVLDLFCGCGGLSLGFIQVGFDVKLGIGYWQDAITTYTATHEGTQGIVADLFNITPEQISQQIQTKQLDMIIGGPPCQGFSIASKRMIDDKRSQLYKAFVDFVRFYQPKASLMENIPNIMSMGRGAIKQQITQDFKQLGYIVKSQILMASDYGVPQNRKRAFFVGFKNGTIFEFPKQTVNQYVTVKQAISDLPGYSVDDDTAYPLLGSSEYQHMMRQDSTGLFNHQIMQHNDKMKETIALVSDGGNYKSLPEHLCQTRNVNIAWTRLDSQKPGFTIDTGHNHHFHYQFNRVPTVRESARIQSFPNDFIFLGTRTSQLRQVGNAVPSMLAKAIAKKMKLFL